MPIKMAISIGTGKLKATQSAKQVLLSCLQLQLSACGQNKVVVTGVSNPTYYIEKLLSIPLICLFLILLFSLKIVN